jgi:RNA polymerase sigma-70 factor (ECF subfamily)
VQREAAPTFHAPDGRLDLAVDLEAGLAELPAEQREVVMLRVWGELTLEETAELLGSSANTVASRYRYALAKLRLRLGAHVRP